MSSSGPLCQLLITSNWNDIDIWIKKNIFKWNLLARWPNYQSKVYLAKVFNLLWESILTKITIVDQVNTEQLFAYILVTDQWHDQGECLYFG